MIKKILLIIFFILLTSKLQAEEELMIMKLKDGDVVIELYTSIAPKHVERFKKLAKEKKYDGVVFHRVIKKPIPLFLQGGVPQSKYSGTLNDKFGTGGFVDQNTGQNRFIPLEIMLNNEGKPRYGETIKNLNELSKIKLTHVRGALSMSRSEQLDSASSQFYISLKSLPELNGRYAVFGKVVGGMRVVDLIEEGDYVVKALRQ